MKKKSIVYLFSVLLAGLGFLSSCTDDETTPGPSISIVNPPSTTAASGSQVDFSIEVEAPERIDQIVVTKKVGTSTSTITSNSFVPTSTFDANPKTKGFNSNTADTFIFRYLVVESTGDVTLTFTVTDKSGKTSSEEFVLTVGGGLKSISGVTLDAQGSTSTGAGSFYSTKTSTKGTSSSSTAADVDITYGVVNSKAMFVSPDARSSASINLPGQQANATKTTFIATNLDFNAVTTTSLNSATDPTATSIEIANNGVYLFKNAAGKKGIIKVTALNAANNGSVTFDVKVVQ